MSSPALPDSSLALEISPAENPPSPSAPRRWTPWLILILLTILGGMIRFSFLDRPCLWGDEANVYLRSCGKYLDMLSEIREEGFGPLHYELYWLIVRSFRATPFVMRFVPALCGTLMVPAIYFLSRQLLQRSTSLVAAAIAACSGFLIFYSRDAKMYSETWLLVTLNIACLLWWFRAKTLTSWLCWVATGALAAATHATGGALLAVSPLLLLTQKNMHWQRTIFWLGGVAVIFAGPIGYYTKFNLWNTNVDQRGWRASGIEWVDSVNRDLSGPDLVRNAGTSFLMGWSWPRPDDEPNITPVLVSAPKLCAELILSILIVALFPWPLSERPRREIDPPPQPQWRVVFTLACLIVLPAYVMYCHSIEQFASPSDWLDAADGFLSNALSLHHHPWIGYALGIFLCSGLIASAVVFPAFRWVLLRGLKWILVVAAILGICEILFHICVSAATEAQLQNRPWHSLWMPRYLGFIWPGVAVAIAALLMRLPTRPIRICAVLFFLAVNLGFGAGKIFGWTEPPTDLMAADAYASSLPNSSTRAYWDTGSPDPGPSGGNLGSVPGRYYLQVLSWKQPMDPIRFIESLPEYHIRNVVNTSTVPDDLRASPKITHAIVWDRFPLNMLRCTDPLIIKMPGWKLVREDWYPIRLYWDWQDYTRYRRREYQRIVPPS